MAKTTRVRGGLKSHLRLPEAFEPLTRPARYKAYYGGRGGAKSHSFASALVSIGVQRPLRILCCREILKSISTSVKQLLDDKIAENGLSANYVSTEYGIKGTNGTEFLFAGLRTNPEAVKSMEGIDIAWVEEANTVSQRSLDLLIPTIRKPGSELWFSWNRRHATDPVDNMFLGGKPPPSAVVVRVNHDDNPWFPDVLETEMEWDKSRDRDKYLHIWEGELLTRSEAKVFQNWRVDDIDDQIPEGCVPRYGADWGFSVDPTVLIQCYMWDRTLYFRREAYKVRCEIDETPSLFAGTDARDPARWTNTHRHPGVEGAERYPITADGARPETISYMRRRGFNMSRAIKGAKSVEEGVEFLKSHDIVVHPDCVHTEDEFNLYSYKVDPLTDAVLPELKDKNNHVIDAARYAVEGARRARRRRVGMGPQVIRL